MAHVLHAAHGMARTPQAVSENNTRIKADKKFPQRHTIGKTRIKLEPNCVFVEDCLAQGGNNRRRQAVTQQILSQGAAALSTVTEMTAEQLANLVQMGMQMVDNLTAAPPARLGSNCPCQSLLSNRSIIVRVEEFVEPSWFKTNAFAVLEEITGKLVAGNVSSTPRLMTTKIGPNNNWKYMAGNTYTVADSNSNVATRQACFRQSIRRPHREGDRWDQGATTQRELGVIVDSDRESLGKNR